MKNIIDLFQISIIAVAITSTNVLSHAEYKFVCPSELTVLQSIVQDVSGWKMYGSHRRHPFVNLSFSEGIPNESYILVPDEEKRKGSRLIARWELLKSTEGYWVLCEYADTSATVARKLPEDVAYCEVEYDRIFPEAVVKQWHCLSEAELKKKAESKKGKQEAGENDDE